MDGSLCRAASATIRCGDAHQRVADTIKPLFSVAAEGVKAGVDLARSLDVAFITTSSPSDAPSLLPELIPVERGPRIAALIDPQTTQTRDDLARSSRHFPRKIDRGDTRYVAPGPRQTLNEAAADRFVSLHEHDR